jgi:hypothetical protein
VALGAVTIFCTVSRARPRRTTPGRPTPRSGRGLQVHRPGWSGAAPANSGRGNGDPVAAGAGSLAAPSSGSPRRGGGPRIAAPHRPQAVPAAAPVTVAAKAGGRPPRASHPVTAQRSPSRALAALASLSRWRYAPPWTLILLGKFPRLSGGRGKRRAVSRSLTLPRL